jgi:hypothetical protein
LSKFDGQIQVENHFSILRLKTTEDEME